MKCAKMFPNGKCEKSKFLAFWRLFKNFKFKIKCIKNSKTIRSYLKYCCFSKAPLGCCESNSASNGGDAFR